MPAAGDFALIADVITYLQTNPGVPLPTADTNPDTGILAQMITGASEDIRTFLGSNVLVWTYTDMKDGQGWGPRPVSFIFGETPVTSVQSVTVASIVIPPAQSTPTSPYQAGYIWSATKLIILGYYVPEIPQCVVVQYTAGYYNVPPDINRACIEFVALRYKERRRLGIESESVSGIGQRTYSVVDMLPSTQAALQRRRRVVPVEGVTIPGNPFII